MAAIYNLTVNQGEDFQKVLTLRDESAVEIDLTGSTFAGQAKLKYTDAEPKFTFVITPRDQALYPGIVDMLIPASQTSLLNIDKDTTYHYDVEWTDSNSKVKRIFEGVIKLRPEVTK